MYHAKCSTWIILLRIKTESHFNAVKMEEHIKKNHTFPFISSSLRISNEELKEPSYLKDGV